MKIKSKSECRWDLVSLGEVMLRLDPGEGRIATTRQFQCWEGGGEYNVARGLKRCFGLDTALVTALADNPVGRLIQDLIYQGGVDQSHVRWVTYDGVGRNVRNGLNFTERGFGVRAALGCSDRGHTAISQVRPGDFDWEKIFSREGARWLHCGGIFAALSENTPAVAREAMEAAHRYGTLVSYDLNYRESLWKAIGGQKRAQEVNRELAALVDVMLGNEEDFSAALGFHVEGLDENLSNLDPANFQKMIEKAVTAYPNFQVVATTLRNAKTATINDWGAVCYTVGSGGVLRPGGAAGAGGKLYQSAVRENLEILDRVGGGDSFASGLIYGFLAGKEPQWAVECGAAHGALAMTTPGDTTMATLAEVERVMKGGTARVSR
jgi:2-dehydro-3-deoxygluconokinase